MADGGNAEFVEIDGLVVRLKLVGSCGSCPSSTATMTMGIKRRMMERIPVRLCHEFVIKGHVASEHMVGGCVHGQIMALCKETRIAARLGRRIAARRGGEMLHCWGPCRRNVWTNHGTVQGGELLHGWGPCRRDSTVEGVLG